MQVPFILEWGSECWNIWILYCPFSSQVFICSDHLNTRLNSPVFFNGIWKEGLYVDTTDAILGVIHLPVFRCHQNNCSTFRHTIQTLDRGILLPTVHIKFDNYPFVSSNLIYFCLKWTSKLTTMFFLRLSFLTPHCAYEVCYYCVIKKYLCLLRKPY